MSGSNSSYPTVNGDEIKKSVIHALQHLKRIPLSEVHENIDIMILTLQGKKFNEICEEVYHTSPTTIKEEVEE